MTLGPLRERHLVRDRLAPLKHRRVAILSLQDATHNSVRQRTHGSHSTER
jgi:hypothetical protein